MATKKSSKGRHIVKCAASGQFFAGISPDHEVLSVVNRADLAEGQADEQSATYLSALLSAKHGSYAWVPAFE